jgi:hypothetical protein
MSLLLCRRILIFFHDVLVLAAALLLLGFVFSASQAGAALPTTTAPWWHLESSATPTNLTPGGEGAIFVTVTNLGDETVNATADTITITDVLPVALRGSVTSISKTSIVEGREGGPKGTMVCTLASLSCTFNGTVKPYESLRVTLLMQEVALGAVSGENEVTVTGGGGPPPASSRRPVTVSDTPTSFGVENYELTPESENGSRETQAGAHPFQLTTTITLNHKSQLRKLSGGLEFAPQEAVLTKDLDFKWPGGLIGNPTVFPHCTGQQFEEHGSCPAASAVGVAIVTADEPGIAPYVGDVSKVYSLEPRVGEPARFGFDTGGGGLVYIDTSVRTGGDYGITVEANDITEIIGFLSATVTVWGVPGDPRHELGLEETDPPPFLSLPTSCASPMQTSVEGDSWKDPGDFTSYEPSEPMKTLVGCNDLPFSPEIKVAPDGQQASRPSGLTTDVRVLQEGQLNATGLANSNIKDIAVTLPEGVALNPAGADGLQACSTAQVGYLPGESHPPGELRFTPKLPDPLEQGLNFCPDASKIGTVKIKTPLLPNPLEGSVYLAAQNENPFGSLVAMYIVAEDPVSGSLVKLPGEVSLNQQTGQILATFDNTPQLAFEDAELHFFGGERAPLSTPAHCDTYTTHATFTPWSGNAPVQSRSSFQITSGPGGGPCPGSSLAFAPSLEAGTTNIQAGAFSTLDTTIGREDGNQNLQAVQVHMPSGLTGLLSGVALCGEAQANAGTCGAESLIGHTTVSVGLGSDPFSVTGGEVFITGPYEGTPFGLSIVNPAKAGPFDLGKVVVRAKIEIDPHTAALTITTDDSGPYKIPSILDGIPLQIKHVAVTIDRPSFTINPTGCNPMAVTGTLSSTEGASAALNVPFQVTNCASLGFAPKFQVSTQGKTSKADGASLTARLSYPVAPQGAQANIARVMVDLPKQLPSRLTTLQKACTSAQFEANPAGCPAASFIGHATVNTPLLPVPLTGPAIFVSHGGEAFPSLVMVLQGYGVTVDLVGTTFISKAGITSTTFKTVPDTPFSTFELTLPEGPFSALTSNVPAKAKYSLCGQKLTMPTEFVAQNGAVVHQSTAVGVTGCARKALTRAQKLVAALKACHKDKNKKKRAACEKAARKQYAPLKKKTSKKKKS